MSDAYQVCIGERSVGGMCWRDLDDACRCCHCCAHADTRTLDYMTFLIVFIALLVVLAVAAMVDRVPDTHRAVSQHGDYTF